jgi:acyl-CoA dehydrogenase
MIRSELVDEVVPRMIRERWDRAARNRADESGWADVLWDPFADAGLPWISVPEGAGGSGGSLHDALALLWQVGRSAVALPVAECGMLGGWLVALSGWQVPEGVLTVATGHHADVVHLERAGSGWVLDARLHHVPWAAQATTIVLATRYGDDELAVLLPTTSVSVEPGRNLAGEPRDLVVASAVEVSNVRTVPAGTRDELRVRGALSRAVLLAGAMQATADLTVSYANERHQFGKPIATFQAVAQHLVLCSAEATAAGLATEVAAAVYAAQTQPWEVAVAKSVTSAAVRGVASHAHQAHGAIGMTSEYDLHHLTRRLWSWRKEYGSERYWNTWLGERSISAPAEELWPRIATGLRLSDEDAVAVS